MGSCNKIGFFGAGNMSRAIVMSLVKNGLKPSSMMIFDIDDCAKNKLCDETGALQSANQKELVQQCKYIFLCVKPDAVEQLISSIHNFLKPTQVLVSIAAGVTLTQLANYTATNQKIIRVMPNICAMVEESMSSVTYNSSVSEEDKKEVISILKPLGRVEEIDEKKIHAVTAVSGSSPAFVFMLIEALSDAAVCGGLPRDKSYRFAAQAVYGAAKMVLETGHHPAVLKDMVCSPGGTTIAAVRSLEEKGFRASIFEGVMDCITKSIDLACKKTS